MADINLDRPNYYLVDVDGHTVECKALIRALGLPYSLGNVLKYLWRAGKKPGQATVDDLIKAKNYLEDEISALRGKEEVTLPAGFCWMINEDGYYLEEEATKNLLYWRIFSDSWAGNLAYRKHENLSELKRLICKKNGWTDGREYR
ncbi:MAG: DUF3310 domain-containing protein [Deltaproteobacteria bacterium]|nr:DUF3310 domain-containing protein [Deltaproteobacteria bacterium]